MEQMFEDPALEDFAKSAAASGADAVAYACTSASFIRGREGNDALCRRLVSASGVPATTTSEAVLAALRALNARRIAVVTPYLWDVAQKLRLFLEEAECDVVSLKSLDLARNHASTPPETIAEQVRQAADPTADALFVSCTALKVGAWIPRLEEVAGSPIVTANQATVWRLLGLVGFQVTAPGRGALFKLQPRRELAMRRSELAVKDLPARVIAEAPK